MAVEAPYSKYRKTNFKIAIFGCLIVAGVLAYDGYLSKYEWSHRQSFYEKHVVDGVPSDTMVMNQRLPFVLVGISIISAVWFVKVKDLKIVADEQQVIIDGEKIPYEAVQKIDKTYFDSKGYFTITYKNEAGAEQTKKLSYKRYDNLKEVLEHLVAKIS
jgi:hypothetical protein